MILLCISVSNIFENDVKSDTGLYLAMSHLSPFLCNGFIMAYFNLSEDTPSESVLLHMNFIGELMKGPLSFRTFVDISSYP